MDRLTALVATHDYTEASRHRIFSSFWYSTSDSFLMILLSSWFYVVLQPRIYSFPKLFRSCLAPCTCLVNRKDKSFATFLLGDTIFEGLQYLVIPLRLMGGLFVLTHMRHMHATNRTEERMTSIDRNIHA